MKFKYRALKKDGERVEGELDATNKDGVIQLIKSNGYIPLYIEEEKKDIKINKEVFSRVSIKDISIFCRQFYTMIDAGIPITSAVNILSNQLPKKRLREALKICDEGMQKGDTLSNSMKDQKVFPKMLSNMVEVGEVTGQLDSIMNRMAIYYEKENKINSKVRNAMLYPIIVAIVSIGVVAILLTYVMPMFFNMFKQNGMELPLITKVVLNISLFLEKNYSIIFLGILLTIFFIKYFLSKNDAWVFKRDLMRIRMPLIRNLNIKIILARFSRTLSTALSSGVPLIKALDTVGNSCGNAYAKNEIKLIKEKVLEGMSISDSMLNSKVFPPMIYSMIKIGEESGALDNILNKTADFYEDELDREIQTLATIIEPVMIVIMGIIIAIIMLSILIPLFNSYSQI